MAAVLPGLYLGGKDDAKDLAWLRAAGIVTIVNCTPSRTEDPVAGVPNYHESSTRALKYVRVPMNDNGSTPFLPLLARGVAAVDSARHYGPVLVHCAHGVSRSASVVAGFLIRTHGLSLEGALRLMRTKRPQVRPNAAFMAQLAGYEETTAAARAAGALLPPEPLPAEGGGGGSGAGAAGAPAPEPSRKRRRQEGGGVAASSDSDASVGCAEAPPLPSSSSSAATSNHDRGARAFTFDGYEEGGRATAAAAAGGGPTSQLQQRPQQQPGQQQQQRSPPAPRRCEECDAAPATVACTACRVAYCAACDADAHGVPSIGPHAGQRVPLPSAAEPEAACTPDAPAASGAEAT
jgi:protein tyrosine phosphatase (PTP) superfamily phosphohydrolase (DUF442 family)